MKRKVIIIVVIILVIIIIAISIYIKKKNLQLKSKSGKVKNYTFKNVNTASEIMKLHPDVREVFSDFISDIESPSNGDLEVTVTSGNRSFDEQKNLNASGVSPADVSLHNFGFALDINVNGTDKNGNPVHLRKASPIDAWYTIQQIGNKYGLTWGGLFRNTPVPDTVHFEKNPGVKASALLALYNSGVVDKDGFVII